jgi:clan AA aspartic protease (TIGR02281 family)
MSTSPPRAPAPRQRSLWRNEFIIFLIVSGALGAWFHNEIYSILTARPVRPPPRLLSQPEPELTDQQVASADAEYADLYRRLGIVPLDRRLLRRKQVRDDLKLLSRDLCDKLAAHNIVAPLEQELDLKTSAQIMRAVGKNCPEADAELGLAGELFMQAGDYEAALDAAQSVFRKHPEATAYWFLQGRALSALKRHSEALAAYVGLMRYLGEPKNAPAELFTRAALEFEAMGRFCEAIVPIETFIAVDPEKRSNPGLQQQIAEDRRRGACEAPRFEGVEVVLHRLSTGVLHTRAQINGVEGVFVVDTGASFVAVSPSFANRARLNPENGELAKVQTANGVIDADLITIGSIQLGGLTAKYVPAVVLSKDVGNGVDGLLGMSFLARFDLNLTRNEWRIKMKSAP